MLILFFLVKKTGSLVRLKVVKSVYFCPVTGAFLSREYRNITSFVGLPTGSVYPTRVCSYYLLFAISFIHSINPFGTVVVMLLNLECLG